MAPEIFTTAVYSAESDVWSAGICMFALCCGKMPFHYNEAEGLEVLFKRIKNTMLDFNEFVWQNVSAEAKDLVSKMLAKKPYERPSISDLLKHKFFNQEI